MKLLNEKRNIRAVVAVWFLSVLLWFMVKMSKRYDYVMDIPLRVSHLSEKLCLKYPIPQTIRVELTGRGEDLLRLNFYPIFYQVDLSDVKASMVLNVSEHPEYVRIPDELELKVKSVIRPQQIEFVMEECHQQKVPVVARYQVETSPGFALIQVVTRPDSILVIGPASYVDTLHAVYTQLVMRKEVNLPFQQTVPIQQEKRYWVQYRPVEVALDFDIQRLAEREIPRVPVEVIHVPPRMDVVPLPSLVTVYVKGGEKILANAKASDFRVFIDFQQDWRGPDTKVAAHIETQLNVLYVETRPAHFSLFVQPHASDRDKKGK